MFGAHFLTDGGETRNDQSNISQTDLVTRIKKHQVLCDLAAVLKSCAQAKWLTTCYPIIAISHQP